MATRRDKQKMLMLGGALAGLLLVAASQNNKKPAKKTHQKKKKSKVAEHAAKMADPITAEPSTLLETLSFLESFNPSLMRRDSKQQGVVTGLSVLSARGVSHVNEFITNTFSGQNAGYWRKTLVRLGILGATETVLNKTRENGEEVLPQMAHSAARVGSAATLSGLIHDSGKEISKNRGSGDSRIASSILVGGIVTGAVVWRSSALLKQRKTAIENTEEDPANKILPAIGGALVAVVVGRALAAGYSASGKQFNKWLGDSKGKKSTAKLVNAGLWAGAATGAYYAGVGVIGKANEVVEDSYSTPPIRNELSGSKNSYTEFNKLGAQGRRFVSDVVTPSQIKQIMGEKKAKYPIRAYVGYNSTKIFPSARAELALMELERTKAFDREYLLLVSPTGTGWVDQTMIESAELLARGDIASVCIQYGRYPSFLSLQKRELGKRQFQLLLWGVKLKLESMPPSKRPKVLVFGESLGAWTASDTIMKLGLDGFDHYEIDGALWVGMPKLAKWSHISHKMKLDGLPRGSMGTFDSWEQYNNLSLVAQKKLRAIILNHDNDPIAHLHPDIIYKRPDWLDPDKPRGRGVPESADWRPVLTFLQTAIDAGNAMRVTPGKFRSHGHDYRADMSRFVSAAFKMKASQKQIREIDEALMNFEIARHSKTESKSNTS